MYSSSYLFVYVIDTSIVSMLYSISYSSSEYYCGNSCWLSWYFQIQTTQYSSEIISSLFTTIYFELNTALSQSNADCSCVCVHLNICMSMCLSVFLSFSPASIFWHLCIQQQAQLYNSMSMCYSTNTVLV